MKVNNALMIAIDSENKNNEPPLYNPPNISKYFNNDLFNEINNILEHIRNNLKTDRILIMGDFNARIGTKNTNTINSLNNTINEKNSQELAEIK